MLAIKGTVSPFLFNSIVREGVRPAGAAVREDGKIVGKIDGYLFGTYVLDGEIKGDAVRGVFDLRGSNFVFVTDAELAAEKADEERKRAEWEEAARHRSEEDEARRQRAIAADKAFNEALGLAFAWHPAYKIVLSGLSATSWGDGSRANSVNHIVLDEDFQAGRLVRRKGDLLCSAANRGSFDLGGEDGTHHVGRVTCKRCLEMATKLKRV